MTHPIIQHPASAFPPLMPARRRRGVASMLAMLYLVLFASLALGFYAAVTMSAQISRNERHMFEAQLSAESGMKFMRYQFASLNLPDKTTPDNLMENLRAELARLLEAQTNVQRESVQIRDGAIYIPSPTKWID